jgi:hypothetical protein
VRAVAELALLYLAPALVLWAFLTRDRYPGERILERVRRVASPAVAAAHAPAPRPPRPPRRTTPRGSVLVAWRLAGRAPPV